MCRLNLEYNVETGQGGFNNATQGIIALHVTNCDTFPAHQKAIILEKACQPTGPTFDYSASAGVGSRNAQCTGPTLPPLIIRQLLPVHI